MKLVISSRNQKKIKELRKIFADSIPENTPELLSLDDIGFEGDVEENGTTFEENAMIKAKAIYDFCGLPVFADDSGICANALNGEPGIYSARYAGEDKNDEKNIDKLIEKLTDKSDKSGYFVCVVAYIDKNGKQHIFRGECHGTIIDTRMGENGFGYDPIFYLEEYKKTFAQIDADLKNKISHRAVAMDKFTQKIKKETEEQC
ncbi:MAG: XTP/dITP diphosphatase [Ruminococcaceae bacterium]|nr:XTP/dITP diphosphatase [Oscillospiraceae bacterium]